MNPLALRKQLLIAESELNRAQLAEEWQTMGHGIRDLAHRAKSIGAWASSAALLVAGVTALRRSSPAPSVTRSTWFQKIQNGARVAWTIWSAFCACSQNQERQQSRSPFNARDSAAQNRST